MSTNFLVAVRDNLAAARADQNRIAARADAIIARTQAEGRSTLTAAEEAETATLNDDMTRANALVNELVERERELVDHLLANNRANELAPAGARTATRQLGNDDRGTALRHIEREWRAPDNVRNAAAEIIDNPNSPGVDTIAAITSDPDYTTAWLKVLRDPVRGHMEFSDAERRAFSRAMVLQREINERAMSVGSNPAGGYMVPFILDPSIVITGTGSINPMRKLATIKHVAAGNYHGVTAGQVSASWDTEASAVSDDTPTLAQPSIPSYLGRVFIPVSFEAYQDIADLAMQVQTLFADAKDNLEATAHFTSTGSGSPTGVVAAVGAVTASRVSPTTGGTVGIQDSFLVQNALPARHSYKASWASSLTIINKMRQGAMAQNSANSVWTDVGQGQPPAFLGRAYNEASAMSATVTTGQDVLLYGNFEKYYICDVIGSPQLEFLPNLLDQATGRPVSQRGYMLWFRQGGLPVDTDAFRILRL